MKSLNISIRFLWEILALIIYGYWGFHAANHTAINIILGIGAPLSAAVIWGTFGAPKAPYQLTGFSLILLEIIIFGGAAAALFFLEKNTLAFVYGVIALINLVLIHIWKQ